MQKVLKRYLVKLNFSCKKPSSEVASRDETFEIRRNDSVYLPLGFLQHFISIIPLLVTKAALSSWSAESVFKWSIRINFTVVSLCPAPSPRAPGPRPGPGGAVPGLRYSLVSNYADSSCSHRHRVSSCRLVGCLWGGGGKFLRKSRRGTSLRFILNPVTKCGVILICWMNLKSKVCEVIMLYSEGKMKNTHV